MDPRIKKIADTVLHHSLKIQKGEKILISALDDGTALVNALVEGAYACGAIPFVSLELASVRRALLEGATQEQLELMAKPEAMLMAEMDCYALVDAPRNTSEFSQLSQEKQALYTKYYKSQISAAKKHLRWVSLTYPNASMAQNAGMSEEAFTDYYFDLMTMDYEKLEKASLPMALRMRAAEFRRLPPVRVSEPALRQASQEPLRSAQGWDRPAFQALRPALRLQESPKASPPASQRAPPQAQAHPSPSSRPARHPSRRAMRSADPYRLPKSRPPPRQRGRRRRRASSRAFPLGTSRWRSCTGSGRNPSRHCNPQSP